MNNQAIIARCNILLKAYQTGRMGACPMPEDSHPIFTDKEKQLAYFTLPMSLNYQRDSYKLWTACNQTFNDSSTNEVFDLKASASMQEEELRIKLLKHKIALQPTKHVATWRAISKTIVRNWGSLSSLIEGIQQDYIQLRQLIQCDHKKGFPYLSGPKIFNYWCYILMRYCQVPFKNRNLIDIAPDTHITQASVKLGLITNQEAEQLSKDELSLRWRTLLEGSGIDPIDMHPPLWFWSRGGLIDKVE